MAKARTLEEIAALEHSGNQLENKRVQRTREDAMLAHLIQESGFAENLQGYYPNSLTPVTEQITRKLRAHGNKLTFEFVMADKGHVQRIETLKQAGFEFRTHQTHPQVRETLYHAVTIDFSDPAEYEKFIKALVEAIAQQIDEDQRQAGANAAARLGSLIANAKAANSDINLAPIEIKWRTNLTNAGL
jgi:hypothetical protein